MLTNFQIHKIRIINLYISSSRDFTSVRSLSDLPQVIQSHNAVWLRIADPAADTHAFPNLAKLAWSGSCNACNSTSCARFEANPSSHARPEPMRAPKVLPASLDGSFQQLRNMVCGNLELRRRPSSVAVPDQGSATPQLALIRIAWTAEGQACRSVCIHKNGKHGCRSRSCSLPRGPCKCSYSSSLHGPISINGP